MTKDDYRPTPPAEVRTESAGGRWTLVFVRELRHAPEKVWRALTDPAELRGWAPFDADRDLGAPGPATLTMAPDGDAMVSTVLRADPPRLLEYDWGGDLLRWELEPSGDGTRLTLRHTVSDRSWVAKVAAGWHICLDVADLLLSGERIGRIVAHEAREHGWMELDAAYAQRLGIESTGWPLGEPPDAARS